MIQRTDKCPQRCINIGQRLLSLKWALWTDADSQLDIDGDGESKELTDGLMLIRHLFGFSGDSLISGAIGSGAERDAAEEVEAYIKERVPVQ